LLSGVEPGMDDGGVNGARRATDDERRIRQCVIPRLVVLPVFVRDHGAHHPLAGAVSAWNVDHH
jgi:hypothetical protein